MRAGTKRTLVLVSVLAVLIAFALVCYSSATEPHPPSPSISGTGLANKIALMDNGSADTLFYHSFSLSGSKATYAFSLQSTNPNTFIGSSWGGNNGYDIYMEKVNMTLAFPYVGVVLLQIDETNVTVEFNGSTYYSEETAIGSAVLANASAVTSYFGFFSPINFTVESGFNNSSVHNLVHLNSYNLSYAIEVTPIIEFGPFYNVGKAVWVSHTFTYPYV